MVVLLFTVSGLQATDVNHDARISALEENSGSGGCQFGERTWQKYPNKQIKLQTELGT